jgi:hypothetical protein
MRLHSLANRSTRIVIASRAAAGRRRALGICSGILAASLLAGPALPATFEQLYTVSVAPDPAAGNQRTDAIRRGMRTLLIRVTGLQQAPEDPRVAGLIASAAEHLDSYTLVSDQEIRIGFRRGAINAELTALGLPIWSDERPLTLLWIAMDFGSGVRAELGAPGPDARQVGPVDATPSDVLPNAADDLFDELGNELLWVADARGLPVALPRLDAIDRATVRFADVWGGFDPLLERAAERYAADAILIGRVVMTGEVPSVSWILRRGDSRQEFVTADPAAGIERLADMYAAEYTIVGGVRQTRITIERVESWPDYGRVLEYLDSLSVIERVDILSHGRNGELSLQVLARGDDSRLRQLLLLGGVLALPAADSPPGRGVPASDDGGLVFLPAWRASEAAAGSP